MKYFRFSAPVEFEAAAPDKDGERKLPRFKMLAYNGGSMQTSFSRNPVVVDLNGLKIPSQSLPIRLQHDADKGVGHTDSIEVSGGKVRATGVISRATESAREVVESSRNEFPWQASIGMSVDKYEYLQEGKKAKVNGRSISGPAVIILEGMLNEISFVDLGADRNTSARVAANARGVERKEVGNMNFGEWLTAKGFDPASLTDEQRDALQAAFEAEQDKAAKEAEKPVAKPVEAPQQVKAAVVVDELQAAREAQAAETERIAAIRNACEGKHFEIEAKAIRENWNLEKVQLEVLRAERPSIPNLIIAEKPMASGAVVEAAIAKVGRLADRESQFSEKDLEASDKLFRHGIGLQEIFLLAAWASGFADRRLSRGNMREALHAAFSSLSLPGILANTANKFLLEGFMAVESVWRDICAIRSVADFKTVTRYRLNGAMQYIKVGPDGELKHGTLGEESYTNKADTYGIIFGVTRTDIINDDLGALTEIPRRIGRGGALKINDVFWTAFLDNSAFFKSGYNNYASGAGTALGIDSLTAADLLFRDQVDADSKPLGVAPAILLVPNALFITARQLMVSTELRNTTASTKYPIQNVFAGAYRPLASSYLGNSSYTGYSALAWYLLANPAELATMEMAFLNGQESPIVESADADFNVLGVQMRGYHDFGAAKAEYRAGIKMKGEA